MKEMTRKEFLKLTGASTALLAMSHIIPTSAYADTSKIDTTVTYALVNPKTKRFTSQTAKKTEYRKATHYDNDSYILEKAYYCFEHNLPSYKENA